MAALVFLSTAQAEPWYGQQTLLVVPIAWADKPSPLSRKEIEQAIFGPDGLAAWYDRESRGHYTLTGYVKPWARSPRRWDSFGRCDPAGIAQAAKTASGFLPRLDNVLILHTGRQKNMSENCFFTNQKTWVFQVAGAGAHGKALPVGLIIHESGHKFYGLPDLYRRPGGTASVMGEGSWGPHPITLDNYARYPLGMDPVSRIAVGWVIPRFGVK